MATLLSDDEISQELAGLSGWTGTASGISRTAELPSFRAVIEAVNQIADVAEEMDHHPEIDIRWRRLGLHCRTHSVGGVSDLDIALARRMDQIVESVRMAMPS